MVTLSSCGQSQAAHILIVERRDASLLCVIERVREKYLYNCLEVSYFSGEFLAWLVMHTFKHIYYVMNFFYISHIINDTSKTTAVCCRFFFSPICEPNRDVAFVIQIEINYATWMEYHKFYLTTPFAKWVMILFLFNISIILTLISF